MVSYGGHSTGMVCSLCGQPATCFNDENDRLKKENAVLSKELAQVMGWLTEAERELTRERNNRD